MRRWIRLASALYPRGWRARYDAEFQALIDDAGAGGREFADVLVGALKMQMSTATTYLKIAGATALAGALVATAVSFGVPRQYVSESVVRMVPRQATGGSPGTAAPDNPAAYQFGQLTSDLLSRHYLVEIISEPSLDLYKKERQRVPMEDVILQMRRDIRISPLSRPSIGGAPQLTARISFAYPDQYKAQAVVRWMVARSVVSNVRMDENRARLWRQAWPSDPAPEGEELVVLDPASFPKPVGPNRVLFMAWGLGAGLLLGLLAAAAMRQPKWSLQMATFGIAGFALAAAVSFLIPGIYTSTAVLRLSPPVVPPRLSSTIPTVPPAEKFYQLEREILSRESLSRIIQKPSLDLYAKQRTTAPLEDIIERMRMRDLSIFMVSPALGSESAFTISFTYPDRFKTSAVVRELVAQFENRNLEDMHSRLMDPALGDDGRKAIEHKLGENLELVEAATVPEIPVAPTRLAFAAAGLIFGLLAGAVTMRFRHRRQTDLQPA